MDIFGFLVVFLFIIGISYGLVLQIRHLLTLKKNDNPSANRKLLFANSLTCFAVAGFLLAFILNGLVHMQYVQSDIITSSTTSISCLLFLFVFLISKVFLTPNAYHKFNLQLNIMGDIK